MKRTSSYFSQLLAVPPQGVPAIRVPRNPFARTAVEGSATTTPVRSPASRVEAQSAAVPAQSSRQKPLNAAPAIARKSAAQTPPAAAPAERALPSGPKTESRPETTRATVSEESPAGAPDRIASRLSQEAAPLASGSPQRSVETPAPKRVSASEPVGHVALPSPSAITERTVQDRPAKSEANSEPTVEIGHIEIRLAPPDRTTRVKRERVAPAASLTRSRRFYGLAQS